MGPGKVYNIFVEGTTTLPREIAPRKIDPPAIFSSFLFITKIEKREGVNFKGPLEASRGKAAKTYACLCQKYIPLIIWF